ncbi:MAG: hypothetical protein D6785_07210, partial [Planctomycetota bacterium]
MDPQKSFILLGKDYEEEGKSHIIEASSFLAGGISKGYDVPHVRKTHPNEDALCAVLGEELHCLAVADAHWGRESSHLAISFCVDAFMEMVKKGYSFQKTVQLFQEIEKELKRLKRKKGVNS